MIALIEPWHLAVGTVVIVVALLVWRSRKKPAQPDDLPYPPYWSRYDRESRQAEYDERQRRASGQEGAD